MKKLIPLPVLLIVALVVGCRTVQPDAGHEAVLVRKPLFFGSGGVDETPVKTGLNAEQYVALQAIQMQREVCSKGGCTFLFGGNAVPLINMK